ncbi:MAG: hypothetical protein WBP16_01170 [Ferruginibacter sp.]
MQVTCLFCGNTVHLVFVHSHYQCPVCKTNALPCCDGDNCSNFFLNSQIKPAKNNGEKKTSEK